MKTSKIITLLLFLIISSFVVYGDVCSDVPQANKSCEMVTPPISCSNYSIYSNFSLVESGNLSNYADGIKYFNFSQQKGQYNIVLCDGTFRQVYVNGDNDMITGSIIALIGVIGILLFIYSKLEAIHKHLKTFILVFVVYLTLIIPRALFVLNGDKFTADLVIYYTWFLRIFTLYMIAYIIYSVFDYYGKTSGIKRYFSDRFGNKGGR